MKNKVSIKNKSSVTAQAEESLGSSSFVDIAKKETTSNRAIFEWFDQTNEKIKIQKEDFEKNIKDLKSEINTVKDDAKNEAVKQSQKSIEVIGIFSALLSFIIVDVNIIKSAETLFSALVLILSTAIILFLFAVLIHILFSPEDKIKLSKLVVWFPIIALITSLCLALFLGNRYPNIMFKESYKENIDKKFIEQQNSLKEINKSSIDQINSIKSCVNYSGRVSRDCFK